MIDTVTLKNSDHSKILPPLMHLGRCDTKVGDIPVFGAGNSWTVAFEIAS